jgi:hypothetical protein
VLLVVVLHQDFAFSTVWRVIAQMWLFNRRTKSTLSALDGNAPHGEALPRYKVYQRDWGGGSTGPAMAMFDTIEGVRAFRANHTHKRTIVLDGRTPIKL